MIGIITPYKVPNYGTKLQAYAMQELLNMYDSAEIINFMGASDYRPRAVLGKIRIKYEKKKNRHQTNHFKNQDYQTLKKERVRSIMCFDDTFYRLSSEIKGTLSLKKQMRNYRAVVCGSDQLWAPLNIDADYFTLTVVPKGIPRISFSASFGVSDIPERYKPAYRRYLNKMKHISVREETGNAIVKEMTGRTVPVTLDPTLMLKRETWEKLADYSNLSFEKYIFCYFLGANPEHRLFAKRLARQTGCQLVSIPHCEQYNIADEGYSTIEISDAQPQDFLNLIRNADYVCTDSFHGTVFSMIFEKKVAVFERFLSGDKGSTNSRIHTLLGTLDAEDALMKSSDEAESFLSLKLNYNGIKQNLENERIKSFAYLDQALGGTSEQGEKKI